MDFVVVVPGLEGSCISEFEGVRDGFDSVNIVFRHNLLSALDFSLGRGQMEMKRKHELIEAAGCFIGGLLIRMYVWMCERRERKGV